ncbi:uncharacterized protein UV8b_07215 [Ustilaginoidea virens]|uniref:Uncharacterized protein n=1 Tax=Ustilaginoidea virens TaxID=1159556 RepID=A0A8E5HWP7_USTVR|nr:uncharacterized protein UV8b_07215 [Ustilaginoidea virens]QUC22974.1 hypothetical protein UV8b_07215 [Ustilaginoidea virens]
MRQKTYSVQTPEDLAKLSSENDNLTVLSQLTKDQLRSSASKWSLHHLIAYRLITQPEKSFLGAFENDHKHECPICQPNKPSTQQIDGDMLESLLQGVTRSDLLESERKLMQRPGGTFWIALAQASNVASAHDPEARPSRERRQVERPEYINSTDIIIGSSSPTRPSSSSSSSFSSSSCSDYQMTVEHTDEDENERLQGIPEDKAVHLAISFVRYVLQLCLIQPDGQMEVRARVERITARASIAGVKNITSEDDSGVSIYTKKPTGWFLAHPSMALIEAKRASNCISIDPRNGRSSPIVSNGTIAQYLGEAVLTWREKQDELHQDIFIIAMCNTFVRFIHFTFGSDYGEYLDASTETEQLQIVGDTAKDTFAYVSWTKWFDLRMSEARRIAACHLLTLVRLKLPIWERIEHHGGPDDAGYDGDEQ